MELGLELGTPCDTASGKMQDNGGRFSGSFPPLDSRVQSVQSVQDTKPGEEALQWSVRTQRGVFSCHMQRGMYLYGRYPPQAQRS